MAKKKNTVPSPKTEEDWEARNDARALIEASKIRGDGSKFRRALKALAEIEKEAETTLAEARAVRNLKERMAAITEKSG